MPKRSITDEEIALIKAMLGRGMKNKNIQFFFNRPDRPVNSGRITGIANGTYANSVLIETASDTVLDAFLAQHKPTPISAHVSIPASADGGVSGPFSQAKIAAFFIKDAGGIWRLSPGEGDQLECKLGFGFKHASQWLKPIAALANNRGGYLFFGVHDKDNPKLGEPDHSYELMGLQTQDFDADPAEFTKRLKATLDPTPRIQIGVFWLHGKKLGTIYVEPDQHRPVIAMRNDGEIKEGDIFYRYPGQSSRIKYSDLRTLLDERDARARQSVLPLVQKVISLGPAQAMIADLSNGQLVDGEHAFLIDQALIDKLNFIREGEFDQKGGAATLRLIGDVQAVDSQSATQRSKFVTKADLIRDFLTQAVPTDPLEYIRCCLEGLQWQWFPIHYFASLAKLDTPGLSAFIKGTAAPESRKKFFIDRANGKTSAFTKASSTPSEFRDAINKGDSPKIASKEDATKAATAIVNLKAIGSTTKDQLLGILTACLAADTGDDSGGLGSLIRRAICRVDELYFRP